jgi:para-nitrobenzyl esterase
MKRLSILSISSFFLTFAACRSHKRSVKKQKPVHLVHTENGMVSGIPTKTAGVEVFKGIPYAAAPVGDLRWRAPQPHKKWDKVLNADHFCANCMQATQAQQMDPPHINRKSVWTKPFLIPKSPMNENCLYLNIWTAAKSSSEKRPVIVWIHGGAFQNGSGSVPVYNGRAMAKKGVVFVTINYRLGVMGFLALPQLTKESGHNTSGNYGLLDQIAALKWVKKNIAAFGGDPDNVTVDGQSAGAFSINYLVASPWAKGLFQRAIGESGGNMISDPMKTTISLQQAEYKGEQLLNKLHVSSLEQLRKLPADTIQKVAGPFNPNIDGYVLPEKVSKIFAEGKQNDVPTLTGWNVDEGTAFSIFSKPTTTAEFKKRAKQVFGDESGQLLKYYPAQTDKEAQQSQIHLTRDLLIAIQNYDWANVQCKTGKSNVYLYTFDRKVPATGNFKFFGAFHSGEIAYALDNLGYLNRPWKLVDRKLADIMSSYWVNFARTGNPNGKGLPNWPVYNPNRNRDMELGKTTGPQPIPNKSAMDFLISYFSE